MEIEDEQQIATLEDDHLPCTPRPCTNQSSTHEPAVGQLPKSSSVPSEVLGVFGENGRVVPKRPLFGLIEKNDS